MRTTRGGLVALALGALVAATLPTAVTNAAAAPAIAANPVVEFVDGIIRGNLNITGTGSQQLRLQFVSSGKGGKLELGNVADPNPAVAAQSFTILPYADWLDGAARGTETFIVRATPVAKAGTAAKPVDVKITVNIGELAPGETPLAFTRKVPGYAGTEVSVNFFPASGLTEGASAPLILQGSALGEAGNVDPYRAFDTASRTPSTASLRSHPVTGGYNVITWDPRGSYASGGVYQLNDPFLDGVDVKNIVTWASSSTPTTLNGPGDPAVGMVGGSSGGELQLVVAGIDPRIDAIAPSTTWNSLITALRPNGAVNVSAAATLLSTLTRPEIRLSPALRAALKDAVATGRFTDADLTLLANKNVGTLLGQLQAPTLLWQSSTDALFSLTESMETAQGIQSNPFGTPVKIAWLEGTSTSHIDTINDSTLAWMDKYVAGVPIPDSYIPDFQWWDQTGTRQTSPLLPYAPGFNGPDPLTASAVGGRLGVGTTCAKPVSGITAKVAVPQGAQIAGVPSVQLRYRGTGKAQAICVRVSDTATGKSLGSAANLVPVVMDGKDRTATLPLNALAFTGQASSQITVTMWVAAQPGIKPASIKASASQIQVAFPRRAPL